MSRPLRSWMFVPGSSQRFLQKCADLPVDAVLLDLEDGVVPEAKPLARTQIADALRAGDIQPARYVRVNELRSPWFADDLDAVVQPGLDGVCLPKTETAADVQELDRQLSAREQAAGLDDGTVSALLAIESSRGLLNAAAIAAASPRVAGLMFGAEDFALDVGLSVRREGEGSELLFARSALVLAARSANVAAIDGVWPDFRDLDGLRDDAARARRLGFDAKSLFHPGQIEDINVAFSPSEAELDHAREVVEAFDAATQRGDGAVAVRGQLIDLPIVKRAQRVLALSTTTQGAAG